MGISRAGFLFFAILGFAPVFAAGPPLAGDYDRALVAVDGDLVTGDFRDCTGECRFNCNFFFEGRYKADGFAITSYYPSYPEAVEGTAQGDGKKLNLRLKMMPGGCWNVAPELTTQGVELLRDPKPEWLQIRMLRKKSHLYQKPGGAKAAEVGEQQIVIVLKKQGRWRFVRKPGGEKTRGWLMREDLFPLRSDSKK